MRLKHIKKKALWILTAMAIALPATTFAGDKLDKNKGSATYRRTVKNSSKTYNADARNHYSENDVKAFVYKWFAGFDHQAEPDYFIAHLDPVRVDMAFPDFPIKSIKDFLSWYQGVIDTIQWNSHHLSGLKVSGSQKKGFSVSLDVRWQANTYDGQSYDMTVHQEWQVAVDAKHRFVITRHRATAMP